MRKTFEQLAEDAEGTVYVDRFEDGVRLVILRGPASLCAYLGIPLSHPLAGNSYDDLSIDCNGGFTYGAPGGKITALDAKLYWWGWDHAHCGDKCFYDLKYRLGVGRNDEKGWTVEDVEKEVWKAVYDLKRLMAVAEKAFAKGAGWRNSLASKE